MYKNHLHAVCYHDRLLDLLVQTFKTGGQEDG